MPRDVTLCLHSLLNYIIGNRLSVLDWVHYVYGRRDAVSTTAITLISRTSVATPIQRTLFFLMGLGVCR